MAVQIQEANSNFHRLAGDSPLFQQGILLVGKPFPALVPNCYTDNTGFLQTVSLFLFAQLNCTYSFLCTQMMSCVWVLANGILEKVPFQSWFLILPDVFSTCIWFSFTLLKTNNIIDETEILKDSKLQAESGFLNDSLEQKAHVSQRLICIGLWYVENFCFYCVKSLKFQDWSSKCLSWLVHR